jgi:hypothetical protein
MLHTTVQAIDVQELDEYELTSHAQVLFERILHKDARTPAKFTRKEMRKAEKDYAQGKRK